MIEITSEKLTLPKRPVGAHKGSFGRVLLFCGSKKYTGAAFFSAQAAVNTGSGLVFLSVPEKIRSIVSQKLNEPIIVSRRALKMKNDACLIGCGIDLSRKSLRLVRKLIFTSGAPLVLDADALTLVAKAGLDLKKAKRHLILTPHEGEFLRLVPEYSSSRREEFASEFAKNNSCTLVLKGHKTLTASPDGELFVNTTGNPGMAKGGSGDVLSGIITSLIGQGIPPTRAAYTAVWLHGRAGDIAAEKLGEFGMTPTDMLCTLKSALKEVQHA